MSQQRWQSAAGAVPQSGWLGAVQRKVDLGGDMVEVGADRVAKVSDGGDPLCMYDGEYIANLANGYYYWTDGTSMNDSFSSNNWGGIDCGGG